jgi:hypothetical protein
MTQVKTKVDLNLMKDDYKDPTQTLPQVPPPICTKEHNMMLDSTCDDCQRLGSWWNTFNETVDDLVLHSNVHNCGKYSSSQEKVNRKDRLSCMNRHGKCKVSQL